jgi:aminoglycoside phosphotransferase (APT) family kinase protein
MHDDEIEISDHLVRSLLSTLSPAYDALPLHRFALTGSSNALFRLGDDLLVRLPRQPGQSETIDKEARWIPHVAAALPVPVPEVVAVGSPGFGYPERWSVVRWLDGEVPVVPTVGEPPRHDLARDLAAVVTALRALPVPTSAAVDPRLQWYRCRPLPELAEDMDRWLGELREMTAIELDVDRCTSVWAEALALDWPSAPPGWAHADLLGENLLVREDRLAAVLDFGALSVGDPTVDLAVAWELLDPAARATFRAAVGVDDETWARGRAWAFTLAAMAIPYFWDSMPARCAARLAMLRQVLAEAQ